jgi:hypothetical protein
MGSSVIQVIQRAAGAAVDARSLMPAVGTCRNAGGIVHLVNMAAFTASYIVCIRASVRAVLAAVAELAGAYGAVNQKPERDRTRPLARRYAFGSGSSGSRSPMALTTSRTTLDL